MQRVPAGKLPERVRLTERERRRLIRFGKPVGPALQHLISIVQYATFRRWVRAGKPRRRKKIKIGRPPTRKELRELVVRMARDSGWGYRRILGELRKLGIFSISRTTIQTILKQHGIEPAPDRAEPTWDAFLKRHAATLWSCDYFTKRVLTVTGLKTSIVLAFMHMQSRQVIVTRATRHPTRAWVAEVAECFAGQVQARGMPKPTILVRDNDGKFGPEFDEALLRSGIRAQPLPIRAPLMNAHIERWIRSLKDECLNHFMPIGSKHLDYLIAEYIEHYHTERPHQGIGNRTILNRGSPRVTGKIECRTRLGGVLRHYQRAA